MGNGKWDLQPITIQISTLENYYLFSLRKFSIFSNVTFFSFLFFFKPSFDLFSNIFFKSNLLNLYLPCFEFGLLKWLL